MPERPSHALDVLEGLERVDVLEVKLVDVEELEDVLLTRGLANWLSASQLNTEHIPMSLGSLTGGGVCKTGRFLMGLV